MGSPVSFHDRGCSRGDGTEKKHALHIYATKVASLNPALDPELADLSPSSWERDVVVTCSGEDGIRNVHKKAC